MMKTLNQAGNWENYLSVDSADRGYAGPVRRMWGTACASRTSRALALRTSAFDTFASALMSDLSDKADVRRPLRIYGFTPNPRRQPVAAYGRDNTLTERASDWRRLESQIDATPPTTRTHHSLAQPGGRARHFSTTPEQNWAPTARIRRLSTHSCPRPTARHRSRAGRLLTISLIRSHPSLPMRPRLSPEVAQ
jgi:hypothetical protein